VERSATERASEAVERCKTVSPSVAGRGGHTIGATMDTSAQVKKKQSGACHYSERKCMCGGENNDANAHVGGQPCPGTAATRLALEKKCEVEHAAIAIRDAHTGASTAM
jgi:hypothetical protein